MRLKKKQFIVQCLSIAVLIFISSAYAAHHLLERVSVSSDGSQANGDGDTGGYYSNGSRRPSISESGRFIVFESKANNLVSNDLNNNWDVFIHDRDTGLTERVNVSPDGSEVSWGSAPSISENGRYVSFVSTGNLIANDTYSSAGVFVRDLTTKTTKRVSVNLDGTDAYGGSPIISSDGRYVAFASSEDNLVPDDTSAEGPWSLGGEDVFVRDLQNETTERVSINSQEEEASAGYNSSWGPSISSDGRFVAFSSKARNLDPITYSFINVFVRDRTAGTTEQISIGSDGSAAQSRCQEASISGDGRYVSFSSFDSGLVANDTNSTGDVFVRDRTAGTTERISVNSDGVEADGLSRASSISPDGRLVAFLSSATNLTIDDSNNQDDVFVHDRKTGKTVCFTCSGTPVTDPFLKYAGRPAKLTSTGLIAFTSRHSNLVNDDTNGEYDVFVGTLFEVKTSSFNWASFLPALIRMGQDKSK